MVLASRTKIGLYEIESPLGAGGMGEVYRARDTKLNRDVEIKVLPELFASDVDRLARFTREAQTLALLNHPHIAQIHGLEESGGVRALVMELVEGNDLAALVSRGPIPLAEVLPFARQIAEALEIAHEAGIDGLITDWLVFPKPLPLNCSGIDVLIRHKRSRRDILRSKPEALS